VYRTRFPDILSQVLKNKYGMAQAIGGKLTRISSLRNHSSWAKMLNPCNVGNAINNYHLGMVYTTHEDGDFGDGL